MKFSGSPEKRPVLIIDDDVDIRESFADALEDRGFEVLTAPDGESGLELLRSLPALPSAILLDLMMPVMDGYRFLQEKLGDPELAPIPVAVITAGHSFDRDRLHGANMVMEKPLRAEVLVGAVLELQRGLS